MAKRRRRHTERSDATIIPPLPSLAPLLRPSPVRLLASVEDRRTYHPDGPYRPARKLSGQAVKPNIVQPNVNKKRAGKTMRLPARIRFAEPASTVICVRRKTRKEVIFAKGKAGKGVRRRRPRRNFYSSVSC